MNPAEIPQYLTTFGPMGIVIWWIAKTTMAAKGEERKDPVMAELSEIKSLMAQLDKRLAVVETILEERKK